ncbi:hypothetical protein GF325_08245, partial [Candidatus Bathyarchaeota archaeon]|nr:hypothetical protein [Candidatus Bathyarchaeota archaeon]
QRELAFTREALIDVLRDPFPVSFKEDDSKESNIIILAHLDGGYREAVESSISSLPYPVEFTGEYQHAGSRDALASLEHAMDELEKEFTGPIQDLSNREIHLQDIRCLVDFQFETSLGDFLIPRDAKISRKHGGMLYIHDGKSHQPILHQDIRTGYLVLDELGVQLAWSAGCSRSETKVKRVTFNGSKLRGSNLFPAGIESVDESIAVGDDAFVVDLEGNLLGYGKAIVPGNRMLEMKRGAVMSLAKKVKPGRGSRNAR